MTYSFSSHAVTSFGSAKLTGHLQGCSKALKGQASGAWDAFVTAHGEKTTGCHLQRSVLRSASAKPRKIPVISYLYVTEKELFERFRKDNVNQKQSGEDSSFTMLLLFFFKHTTPYSDPSDVFIKFRNLVFFNRYFRILIIRFCNIMCLEYKCRDWDVESECIWCHRHFLHKQIKCAL